MSRISSRRGPRSQVVSGASKPRLRRRRVAAGSDAPNTSSSRASVALDAERPPDSYVVGRILADELRRFEISEWSENVWDAADADSSGLEAAYAALLDENGDFRQDEFESVADPVVYLYRFARHEDFREWRMSVLDAFCRTFGNDAVILAQYHTTSFTLVQFEALGFRELGPTQYAAPKGLPRIDRETSFMVRENAVATSFALADYPEDAPAARPEHTEWLETRGRWEGLV